MHTCGGKFSVTFSYVGYYHTLKHTATHCNTLQQHTCDIQVSYDSFVCSGHVMRACVRVYACEYDCCKFECVGMCVCVCVCELRAEVGVTK